MRGVQEIVSPEPNSKNCSPHDAPADRTTREPGEPGVRLRCFADPNQEPDTHA